MKTYTPEQLELMVSKAANQTVDTETAERVLRQAAAQARVIAGMEDWCQKRLYGYSYHPSVILAELARLLTEHGLTPPKDQP